MSAAPLLWPAWVFDMDGTLTVPTPDFEEIREELGLPPGRAILEQLDLLPEEEAAPLYAELARIEEAHAHEATVAPGARELLEHLEGRARLGILTRNTRANAFLTLQAVGLAGFFEELDVLGRDEAPPKPDPAGVLELLGRWGHAPAQGVMVGDYRFDLEAGRAAGTAVVYCDQSATFEFAHLADHCVASLGELLPPAGRSPGPPRAPGDSAPGL